MQRRVETPPQIFRIFQADGEANEVARDATRFSPIEFGVVRQQSEWTGEREDGSETWAFAEIQPVINLR